MVSSTPGGTITVSALQTTKGRLRQVKSSAHDHIAHFQVWLESEAVYFTLETVPHKTETTWTDE